jgi:hypothetical protein
MTRLYAGGEVLMRFYRGIAVPRDTVEAVLRNNRTNGLQPGDGDWRMVAGALKSRLTELWAKRPITLKDTRPESAVAPWVCACAEEHGALYYACRHNQSASNDTPILIEFEAPSSEATVDGRDFLYTVFQMGEPTRARPMLERIFGSAILRYADRAWSSEPEERIPLCDLAVQDDAVVREHAANRLVIAGRYGTRFRSAFLVRLPVPADRITGVRVIETAFEPPEADVSLDDCLVRRRA